MPKQTPARKRYKKKYYKKYQSYNLFNSHSRYSDKECKMILVHDMTDIELAKLLHRSLMSIQIKRVRLKKIHTLYLGW